MMKKAQGVRNVFFTAMILTFTMITLTSCSGEEQEVKTQFSTAENDSLLHEESEPSIIPGPGHVVIGELYNVFSEGTIPETVLSEYCRIEGTSIEFREYNSDKALIEAARAGEIDIVFGDNLVSNILAQEDLLVDLDPYLSEILQGEDYYKNIIDAGRIGEKLVMVCPYFGIGNALGLPQGAVEAFGEEPRNLKDILVLYNTLEEDYRADSIRLGTYKGVFDIALHLENRSFDIEPLWPAWTALLSAMAKDAGNNRLYEAEGEVYHALLSGLSGSDFADPDRMYNYYCSSEGEVYTHFGSKAILVPFSVENAEGFTVTGGTYAIPEAAPHPEAALHFVQWIMSPEGQEAGMQDSCSCPVLRSEAIKWFLRWHIREHYYTTEEKQEIAEAYIARADRYPVISGALWQSLDTLLLVMGNEEGRQEYIESMTSTEIIPELGGEEYTEYMMKLAEGYAYLLRYGKEHIASLDETVPFYDENVVEDWPTIVNEYVRGYITELGYEMH